EWGTGNREQGTGIGKDWEGLGRIGEQGTGNREQGTGNRQKTIKSSLLSLIKGRVREGSNNIRYTNHDLTNILLGFIF
ncbi:hypothetical protein, partial [Anabaenopsis arnoldii]